MIFESGMHFDFDKAQIVGPKACVVAVLGTFLPLITGTVLTMIYGKPFLPDGVAVGTALAPTSVGIALRLLGEAGVLQENFGQAIITAAFVDDILSLVLFNVLFSLKGDFDVVTVVVFPVVGITFMAIAMVLAVKFWPWLICEQILPRVPSKASDAKVDAKDEVLFLVMMLLLVAYATITHFLGTHLWGCFIAGMSFACLQPPHHAHHVWVKQTKRATSWMIRIFFAATVAFSIPVSSLLSFEAFWKGSIMGIGPCIATKVLCAPFMGETKFVIGWAMVGRAEFAYLIAQMAFAGEMIDSDMFSIVIWALLYATIFAPFIFRTVLNQYVKMLKDRGEAVGPKENHH
jgi:Kef-type K+ transport system membrane component KefB